MSVRRGTGGDDSKGFRALRRRIPALRRPPLPSVVALRGAFAAAGLAGAAALVIATFATIIEIEVLTVPHSSASGWDRHGPALILLALFAVVMLAGALRGSRPAMAAVAAAGVCALLIALAWDLPDLHDVGAVSEVYSDAHAGPKAGYYLETAGGALLLLSGGGLLLLPGSGRREAEVARPRRKRAVA